MVPYIKTIIQLAIFLQLQYANSAQLECYECSNVRNVSGCHTSVFCQEDHQCSINSTGSGDSTRFDLGCRHKDQCPTYDSHTTTMSPVSIVGRDVTSLVCDQCCAVDACNKHMCLQDYNTIETDCADDPTFNCAQISGVLNLCSDRHHAKTVCRKYCGLCDLVDGIWSTWSPWSSCDVTCENGSNTRLRMCDNPAPANGGLSCSGQHTDQRQCSLDDCPIHGGWSSWTGWGSCSTPFGAGLQKKTRTCSNPPPSRFGDHCFGDSTDFKSCFKQACAGHHVAFYVDTPTTSLTADKSPTFSNIITNVGGGYNTTTGIFTCPVKGLYQFSITLSSSVGGSSSETYCFVNKNAVDLSYVSSTKNIGHHDQSSISLYLELLKNDTVCLKCNAWDNISSDKGTIFTGALISTK